MTLKKKKKTFKKESFNFYSINQSDFNVDDLGENKFPSPLRLPEYYFSYTDTRILYNNVIYGKEPKKILSFARPGPSKMLHFNPHDINVGIVSCGGLCPGINDVIRAITYNCISTYKVKNVYGFRCGFQGLTSDFQHEAVILNDDEVDNIHEMGGTILSSSRGPQKASDMVDTLVKFNISILFTIGGDGTQTGAMTIVEEIRKRKLDISIIGIPKTIDNDLSYINQTFGFTTAVEEARKAINAAHVEAKGARNGIGIVKLMGRHSGFIAAHVTLASGNVNICLIPEIPLDLKQLFARIEDRLEKGGHVVVAVAEGTGQDLLYKNCKKEYDASGNLKLKDIGSFLKQKIKEHLAQQEIPHTIKYIDPSYMIRSTPANGADSSFCLRLGNVAVHAGMAGKTNVLIGYWNQHFTLTPITLALKKKKVINLESSLWQAIEEITT